MKPPESPSVSLTEEVKHPALYNAATFEIERQGKPPMSHILHPFGVNPSKSFLHFLCTFKFSSVKMPSICDNRILWKFALPARGIHARYAEFMQRDPSQRSKVEIVTAAVAIGSIGGLVGLTVTGVLKMLPQWAATAIVVAELLAPMIVYYLLKRAEDRR